MSPHATIFARRHTPIKDQSGAGKRLAVGVTHTRNLFPEEIGTNIHAREVVKAVKEAMADAAIDEPSDVHFVQIKCPLLTSDRMNDAEARGKKVVTKDTLKSMAYSRGASALGVAIALNEIDEKKVTDSAICNDWSLFSNVASTSAGLELMNNEIVVMGNSSQSSSDYVIGHSVMQDLVDSNAVWNALRNAGIESNGEAQLGKENANKVVNVFAKAGAHPSGLVRGRRTTMLTDSDIPSTRHARAVVNGVIASIVGDPMVYVSGGTEHQGPLGGGPIAVVAHV
jgi:cyanuric acid amidohydrolase